MNRCSQNGYGGLRAVAVPEHQELVHQLRRHVARFRRDPRRVDHLAHEEDQGREAGSGDRSLGRL